MASSLQSLYHGYTFVKMQEIGLVLTVTDITVSLLAQVAGNPLTELNCFSEETVKAGVIWW